MSEPTTEVGLLSRDNPKARWHQEEVAHGRSSWACIPLTDAIAAEARASLDVERERDRLLTAVEAAILNIQHNRVAAAIAGLRAARDLTRADKP